MRDAIVKGSESLDDQTASEVPDLFPVWKPDTEYGVGDRRRYGETLYKCLLTHTSQSDWTPDVAVSLWVRTDNPGIEWPEWIQPTGAHDAYERGAKVSHNGLHWVNDIDANIYEPGVYGWTQA